MSGDDLSRSEKGLVDLTEPRLKGKTLETTNPKDKNRTDPGYGKCHRERMNIEGTRVLLCMAHVELLV